MTEDNLIDFITKRTTKEQDEISKMISLMEADMEGDGMEDDLQELMSALAKVLRARKEDWPLKRKCEELMLAIPEDFRAKLRSK